MSSDLAADQPALVTPWFRYATTTSLCSRPGCTDLILPGQPIMRPGPARAWRHRDCLYPNHIAARRAQEGARAA